MTGYWFGSPPTRPVPRFIAGAGAETAVETVQRLYGSPTDVDKVWQDREALQDAQLGEKP